MAISTNLIKSFQLSALTTALALAGCGGGGGNDTLPPPSKPGQSNGDTTTPTTNVKDVDSMTITKSFNTFILKQDEKFTIIANALKSGKPVEGVIVDAIIPDPATSGIYVITPTPITTNANGEAAIELQIKDLAKAAAYLKANSDKLSISVKPTNSKQAIPNGTISLTGAAPATSTEITNVINDARSLTLSPSNANFKLEVGTKITVSAFVADDKGGALKNVPVTFDLPNLPRLGIYNLSGSTVNTDDRGIATITLQVMSLDKREDLKNGFQVDAFIDRDIDLKASNRPTFKGVDNLDTNTGSVTAESLVNSIILTPNVDSIPLTIGSTFTLTVTTNDKDNKPIGNAPIAFTYPTLAEYGLTVANSSATTNGSGQATVTFTVNSLTTAQKAKLIEGFTVNASSNGKFAQASLTAKNETAESLVNSISLTPSVDTISLTPNAQFSVTATTLGKDGKPVSNAPVAFSYPTLADYGLTIASSSTNTNGSGQAVMTFAVNASLTTAQKAKLAEGFTVNASSNAKTATAVTLKSIKVATVADIANVSLVTNKDTLTTNTGETINVTAQVRDANNVGLANMPVSFTLLDAAAATGITNTTPLQATTDANGEAVLTLKVGALTPDQKYYLQTSGLSFKATAGTITSSTVTLKTQEAITANSVNTLLLTSDSAVQLALGSKVKVTALAIDKNGAVVPNAQVSFKVPTDSGLVNNTGAVVNTNANGEATIEVEIKDLAKATTALQNGLVVTAQSGVSVGTTTVRGATSNANTEAYKLFVSPSKTTLRTATDTATLGIKVTDTKGGIKAGIPVQIQIAEGLDKGITFDKSSNLVTDANGYVQVNVIQSDIGLISKLDHTAKVKVIVNDGVYQQVEQTIDFTVTGTHIKDTFISKSVITDSASDTVIVSGVAVDGNDKPIANQSIQLLNDGTALAVTPVTTDTNGKFTFTLNGSQLPTATTNFNLQARIIDANNPNLVSQPYNLGSLTKVSETNLSLTVTQNGIVGDEVKVDTPATIIIDLPNTVANDTTIYLTTNKGTLGSNNESRVSTTAQGGKAIFNNLSSISPGVATLTVEYNGAKQLEKNITFITDKVTKVLTQVINTTVSTNGETKIIATVRDDKDAPVKNAIVDFTLLQDASSGKLSTGTAITDEAGNAIISYFAGSTPTPVNGVKVQARVQYFKLNNQLLPISTTPTYQPQDVSFTVQNFSAWIGFAFADKVAPTADNIYYIRAGSIFINNSIGQPAVNQEVSISIVPKTYGVGLWKFIAKVPGVAAIPEVKDPTTGAITTVGKDAIPEQPAKWITQSFMNGSPLSGTFNCLSEDFNRNATLDTSEDYNGDGMLTPLNPITVLAPNGTQILSTQTVKTDATGKLDFSIRYGKEYAQWLTATVRVTTKVDGSEFSQERDINLPVLDDDVITEDNKGIRPNTISPFGTLVSSTMLPYCSFSPSN